MLSQVIDAINTRVGQFLGWVTLGLILVQFGLVIGGSVFAANSLWLQEGRLYLNAMMFLGAAGYTLLADDHVRVDLFYRDAPAHHKAWINLLGILVLLLPTLILMGWASWPTIVTSWTYLEGSTETAGLPLVYIFKSFLLLFVISLAAQALSEAIKAWRAIHEDATG